MKISRITYGIRRSCLVYLCLLALTEPSKAFWAVQPVISTCSASTLICVFPLVVYEREISTLKAKLDEANQGLEHYKKMSHAQAREIEDMKKNYEEARVATLLAGMRNIHTHY